LFSKTAAYSADLQAGGALSGRFNHNDIRLFVKNSSTPVKDGQALQKRKFFQSQVVVFNSTGTPGSLASPKFSFAILGQLRQALNQALFCGKKF
jgi:hypothetical protein